MPADWYYVKNSERRGPVSLAKLKSMAADGWLAPDDLVWHSGMVDWVPARSADGVFANPLGDVLHKTIAGLRPTREEAPSRSETATTPPSIPAPTPKETRRHTRSKAPEIPWDQLAPRHIVAACGGFLAALGIAFTVIAQSRIALAFTLSGLFIAAAGLYVEVGRLVGQAIENIGKASTEAAERRLRAKELALEKQRLDVEAARIAQEQAAREAPPVPAAVLANQPPPVEYPPPEPAGSRQIVVVNQPPIQRWSPGLAAVLSFFLPGLGQLYKGQILNGIVWFFLVGMGYVALFFPGLILHCFCDLGALSGNPWTEGKTTVVRQ